MNILWIPHAPWHIPQREQYLVQALASQHHLFVTDWDTDFHRVTDYVSARYLKNFIPRRMQTDGVTIYHVPRLSPALYMATIRRFNARLYQRSLSRIVEQHHIDWVIGSFVVPYQDLGVPVSIDVCDDNLAYWHEGGGPPDYAREIQANEDSWLRFSQHVTVVSSVLGERMKPRIPPATPVAVIPNGVDLKTFVPASDKQAVKEALGLERYHRHIACIGAFNRRGELERVLAVARRMQPDPSVSLVIVGAGRLIPTLRAHVERERLRRVIFAGFQTGSTLLRYFQACDVGLCPYPVTYGLQAASPLRLLQYSAVGATVVIPLLETVRRMGFSNVLFCDDSHEDFAQSALKALDVPGHVPQAIYAYDWSRLADALVGMMPPNGIDPRSCQPL